MKLDQYSKISIAISIEIWVLLIINIILKTFIKEFNSLYIVIAQISLLVIQLINVILQKKHYEEEWKKLFKDRKEGYYGTRNQYFKRIYKKR